MKDLQKILNNYLIILNHIPDHRGDYLQLFLTMDAKGHYLLSDGGYIQKELALLEENWEGFTDKADFDACLDRLRLEKDQVLCQTHNQGQGIDRRFDKAEALIKPF